MQIVFMVNIINTVNRVDRVNTVDKRVNKEGILSCLPYLLYLPCQLYLPCPHPPPFTKSIVVLRVRVGGVGRQRGVETGQRGGSIAIAIVAPALPEIGFLGSRP